jgi:hypothetical protein
MTRRAAEAGLHRIVDDIVVAVREEFDPVRALRQGRSGGPVGTVVNGLVTENGVLDRYVVEPEAERQRADARRQVSVTLNAVTNDEPIESYRETLLEADVYYRELDSGVPERTREAVADAVCGRYRTVAESVAPVVTSPEEEFWPRSRAHSPGRKRSNSCARTVRSPRRCASTAGRFPSRRGSIPPNSSALGALRYRRSRSSTPTSPCGRWGGRKRGFVGI